MASAVDVLGFEDGERVSADGTPALRLRKLTLNGIPLDQVVAAASGESDGPAAPLLSGNYELAAPYLDALIGGAPTDSLRPGRIALGYCGICLDDSCGVLFAATLEISEFAVSWTDAGYEREPLGQLKKSKLVPPPEWWEPNPLDPKLNYVFDRAQYESAIAGELTRMRQQ